MNTLKSFFHKIGTVISALLLFPIRLYQEFISSLFPPVCRFTPTCSVHAVEALKKHGSMKDLWLAVWRILRGNPWVGSEYDPVL